MDVRLVQQTAEWEEFLLRQPYTLFVQSSWYGQFYETLGESAWIFGIYENNQLIGGSLVVSTHAKRGDFLYLPYGPILPEGREGELLPVFVSTLTAFAKEKKYAFIRMSPFLEETDATKVLFKQNGFRNAPMHILAETTWLLDISKSEEELLASMNKNHRNLIRRCEREGVRVTHSADQAGLSDLNTLLDHTAIKHHFVRFSKNYLEKEFHAFAPSNSVEIFRSYLPDGTLDAAAEFMFFGNMACYRHSASLNLDHKLPTSYLIQWEAIKEAKRRGIVWYNFWGIAPPNAANNHPFRGITHFKTGFGGFQKDVLHCQDLPLSPWYWLNWAVETIRRQKRGF